MARSLHDFKTVSILNAGTDSVAITLASALGAVNTLMVFSPTTLPETINIQVAPNSNPTAGDWKTLQWQPGTDVVIAANKAVNIPLVAGFKALRLHATGAVAAQRDFQMLVQIDADAPF